MSRRSDPKKPNQIVQKTGQIKTACQTLTRPAVSVLNHLKQAIYIDTCGHA
jgi:hypothetical protein